MNIEHYNGSIIDMKRFFKVLFIARRFPPSVGGMERFAYDLSNALESSADITKITWGGSNKWLPLILPIFFFRAVYILIVNRNIDIIHIQDGVQAPIGWLLHILFRKPYIIIAHGLDITYQNIFYQAVILPFVRRADAVISISTATKGETEKRGVKEKISHVITLGTHDDYGVVRPDRKALSDQIDYDLGDKVLLLTTGRLVKRKGVAWFILNVLPSLVKTYPKILYFVAGDGSERDTIEKAIVSAGMSDYVVMLGRVSDEVRSLIYQSSDIFVMPNIAVPGDMEGFGIVAHEAATAALPVVASNLEGIADALHNNKNGILVESANAEQFINEISKFVNDKPYRNKFGSQARKYTLEAYDWKRIADQYIKIYSDIMKKYDK